MAGLKHLPILPPITSLSQFNHKPCSSRAPVDLNVRHFKKEWARTLAKQDIPEPDSSVRFIVQHVLRTSPPGRDNGTAAVRHRQDHLTRDQFRQATDLLKLRLKRVPVQYIVGEWEFRNLTLTLRPPVLIPRPETEELVGLVLKHCCPGYQQTRSRDLHTREVGGARERVKFLDIGCGSGPISLSLLQECPQMSGCAVDVSKEAVTLTKENACQLGLSDRLLVIHSSVETLHNSPSLPCRPPSLSHRPWADLIVSNPPYIPTADIPTLDPSVSWYEDRRALDGGEDGMEITRQILHLSSHHLKIGGQLWLELGINQDPSSLLTHHSSLHHLSYLTSHKDHTQRTRFHQLVREKE